MTDWPRANYGPDETPRACPECGCRSTRVVWTEMDEDTKYRHRACRTCGEAIATTESRA